METKHLRWGLGGLLALAFAVFLAPPPPTERKFSNREPVIFWHSFAGEWQPIYQGMIDRFNQSQDKYEVVGISIPDDTSSMKFLLSASGGSTPDVMLSWDSILGTWSDMGLIQPYDNLMPPAEKQQWLNQTYPVIKRHSMYNGKIMAMIDGLDSAAVYYRLNDLKEVGVDKDHLPQTLDDLVELGHKLDRYDKDHHVRRMGFMPKGLTAFAPSFGGKFNDNGHIVIDTPANLRAMAFVSEAVKRYGYDDYTKFTASLAADAGPSMPLIAGNFSIMLDGEWRVKQVEQYSPGLPYVVAPIPPPKGGKPNASYSSPNYLVIPTAAKNPQGAYEFAKFCVGFQHPEEGGLHMGEMGWVPDDPFIANSKSYQAYLKKYPQYKTFVDLVASPNLEIPPQGPLQAFVIDQIAKVEDSAVRGTITPKAALEEAEKQLALEIARRKLLGRSP